MPSDRSLVYIMADAKLSPLTYETAKTPLNATAVASSNRNSYVELTGSHSSRTITTIEPRIFIFVPDQPNAHPPFLVRLSVKKNARRVTALTEKGRPGYAIASEEIVKPHYRVLGKEGGLTFMEVRPREPLIPGEYAIMGSDLSRVATFTVAN